MFVHSGKRIFLAKNPIEDGVIPALEDLGGKIRLSHDIRIGKICRENETLSSRLGEISTFGRGLRSGRGGVVMNHIGGEATKNLQPQTRVKRDKCHKVAFPRRSRDYCD